MFVMNLIVLSLVSIFVTPIVVPFAKWDFYYQSILLLTLQPAIT
jgi:hypothetical protein